ncbi:MAG: NnrU family protein [Phyllobacteriaceae bacterium]|nr:NnrU family protein [Phyllobacteriaceae bacterium]
MTVLILGLILFLGIHSLRMIAPAWRDAQYAKMGEGPWKGAYSAAALVGLVLLIWGYSLARADAALLYEPPVWMKHVNATIMLIAFIVMGTNQRPAGMIKRAVKHPMLVSTKLWAFGHLLANGDLASVLLFGSFLVWAVANRIAVGRRPATPQISGSWRDDVFAVVVGLALYLVFLLWAHSWLFGVAPL